MNIEIKYKPNDNVCFMENNRLNIGKIDKIDIVVHKNNIDVCYFINDKRYAEDNLFSNKDEFITRMKKDFDNLWTVLA